MRSAQEKTKQPPESLMTPHQVADFLQVSVMTVRRWTRSRQLNGYRVGGRGSWRYRREDVLTSLRPGN